MSNPFFASGLLRRPSSVREQFDEVFRSLGVPANIRAVSSQTYPPVNVGASADSIEVAVLAPGLDPAQIQVAIDKGLLTISGERQRVAGEGKTFYARERAFGKFQRVVELPQDADPDQVDARYVDGCLSISIKKRESSKPRLVAVQ